MLSCVLGETLTSAELCSKQISFHLIILTLHEKVQNSHSLLSVPLTSNSDKLERDRKESTVTKNDGFICFRKTRVNWLCGTSRLALRYKI